MTNPEKKPVGKTKDAGYQIGVRKILPVDSTEAWEFLAAGEELPYRL